MLFANLRCKLVQNMTSFEQIFDRSFTKKLILSIEK